MMNFNVNYKNFIRCLTDDLYNNINAPIRHKSDASTNNDIKTTIGSLIHGEYFTALADNLRTQLNKEFEYVK